MGDDGWWMVDGGSSLSSRLSRALSSASTPSLTILLSTTFGLEDLQSSLARSQSGLLLVSPCSYSLMES